MKLVIITISGKAKTGKSTMAQEIRNYFEVLGATVKVVDSSPNSRYRIAHTARPLKNLAVEVNVKEKAK